MGERVPHHRVDMKKFRTVFSAVRLWHTGIMTVF